MDKIYKKSHHININTTQYYVTLDWSFCINNTTLLQSDSIARLH